MYQKCKKNTLYNIEMLYKARNEAIKFYDDYSSMMSEAKYKATKGKGLKILTPKQMVLILKLTNKSDLRIGKHVIALSNLSIYYTWNDIKSSYNNNKFKVSAPTWNDEFKLPDGSYSVSDIQDYF